VIVWSLISETERRIKILDYVRENSLDKDPRITKSDIMKHLKDSRPMTTHKITIDLIKEGKINMVKPKDKPYSQIDYLIINEKNEFNKIYNSISEIERIIYVMQEPVRKISKLYYTKGMSDQEQSEARKLEINFKVPFKEAINVMFQELLGRVFEKVHSENDKQILYARILDLLRILTLQFWPEGVKVAQQLDSLIATRLKLVKPSALSEAKNINVDLANDLITVIENFENQFLIDRSTEHKTRELGQKSG
jgi:hypothetical protein